MVTIRPAALQDLEEITNIYNEAILNTVATFDTEIKTIVEQEKWFNAHGTKYPILVAVIDKVVGWASLSQWSDRCAYSDTAEISLYIKEQYRGQGVGKKLLAAIIQKGQEAGLHTVIARIAEGNEVSIHLHEVSGFDHIGVMREVGQKFGRRLDVYLMQKIYSSS